MKAKRVAAGSDRPPRLEVVEVASVESGLVTVVLRGWRTWGRGPLILLYRLRLDGRSGEVRAALLNGEQVAAESLPGVVLDLGRTMALDATGRLAIGWPCS